MPVPSVRRPSEQTHQPICIVDDDTSMRCSIQQLLDSENTIKADCLIVDVRMPDIDGLQLMRCLRANNQRIPVIVLAPKKWTRKNAWIG